MEPPPTLKESARGEPPEPPKKMLRRMGHFGVGTGMGLLGTIPMVRVGTHQVSCGAISFWTETARARPHATGVASLWNVMRSFFWEPNATEVSRHLHSLRFLVRTPGAVARASSPYTT
jgi:hypothetical protein